MHSGVPPPPAPAPPPPPPPPPAPGIGCMSRSECCGSKMRNFNWDTIPKHSVMGKHNIWTAPKTLQEYQLDTEHMTELFSHSQPGQGQLHNKALKRQSLRGLPTSTSGHEVVTILSSKRSMNIGIFLKQFKRSVIDMIEDIHLGNIKLGTGKLRELCKLLPKEGEVQQLVRFNGNKSALPEADLFMLMLVKIPSYEERLNSLVLKEEFFPLMEEMHKSIRILTTAGQELLECDELHSVIRLVLKTGNYMNAGGYAGSAVGFRMTSLLKLVDTKANKPDMNLMHYVVMQAQKADVTLLKFTEQLKHIGHAARISKDDIEAEFEREVKKIQQANTNTEKQEDLKPQMEDFLKEAEARLEDTQISLQRLNSVSDSVAEYFCEDPSMFKLEECCTIFKSFCDRFLQAIQENKNREGAEMKRRHREKLELAARRRSTATCSSMDKEMEGIALESMLQSILTSCRSRRRVGKPSSADGSPTNGSLSEIVPLGNLPTGDHHRSGSVGARQGQTNLWNSAGALMENSAQDAEIHNNQCEVKGCVPGAEEELKTHRTESRCVYTTKRTGGSSSSGRPFSVTIENAKEEEPENNIKEEVQKLREVSKNVLHYQNSRSSVSSGDHSLDNPKSHSALSTSPHQRETSSEDSPGDNTQLFSKTTISRHHTLPVLPKDPASEEEEDYLWEPPCRRQNPTLRDIEKMKSEDVILYSSTKHKLGLTDHSHSSETSATQSQKSIPRQEDKTNSSLTADNQTKSQKPPPKPWFKADTNGFLNFFRRLGEKSKQLRAYIYFLLK